MRSLRLLKYARIRLPIVEVRTKRHYELEAVKLDNNGEYSGKLVAGNTNTDTELWYLDYSQAGYSTEEYPEERKIYMF